MNKLDTERDPPIFETRNLQGKSALLLVCDHAGNAIPKSMDNLGYSKLMQIYIPVENERDMH